jgi:hypothetical protein
MKKAMVLVGLMIAFTQISSASEVLKMPVRDFINFEKMDYVFEIKTTKFDQVVLDCQSFITGMSFSNNGQLKSNVYLDMFACEDVVDFLTESKEVNRPVCLGLNPMKNELTFSVESEEKCK